MSDSAASGTGRFVWFELMSPDPDASKQYYSHLFGWTTSEMPMEFGAYTMFHVGQPAVAGLMQKPAEPEFPTHWGSYVTVDDVDAACDRASARGGMVAVPPTDIPGIGRFACVIDPHGAAFYPFRFAGEAPPDPPSPLPHGMAGWVELHSPDPDASVAFYRHVVGWDHRRQDMGPLGQYEVFRSEGADRAGVLRMPPSAQGPAQWMIYVKVPSVAHTVTLAEEMGGRIWVKGMDIPGIGRIGVHSDPHGAMIAFFRPE